MPSDNLRASGKIELPMIQPSPFWIFLKEMKVAYQRVLCTCIFVTALFTVAKTWKQPKYLSMDEWIKVCCVQWKILKEMGIPDHLTYLLRNLYAGQEAAVRTGHGTVDCFKIGKEYIKAVHCHPDYLTYMQSTSYEMPGWINHKLKSGLAGEISTASDMQMTPL